MRLLLLISLMMVSVKPTFAQLYYAEQGYPQPQTTVPHQVSENHVIQPYYAPAYTQPQQVQPVQPPVAPAVQPQPWDYGQSVKTDIRQMNF